MEKRELRRKKTFKKITSESIDKAIFRTVIFLLFFLLLTQSAHFFMPQMRARMNTAIRLEGTPLKTVDLVSAAVDVSMTPWAVINLKLLDYISRPEIEVLLDGKKVADFSRNEVAIKVKHGSIIAVRNLHAQLPVTIIVNKKTPNIIQPEINSKVAGSGVQYFEPVVLE